MKVLVSGEVPQGAGLSSSSALVCASCLAVAAAIAGLHSLNISRQEMADACMRSERLVGTMGGGLDQAISFLGPARHGMLIGFTPFRSEERRVGKKCGSTCRYRW